MSSTHERGLLHALAEVERAQVLVVRRQDTAVEIERGGKKMEWETPNMNKFASMSTEGNTYTSLTRILSLSFSLSRQHTPCHGGQHWLSSQPAWPHTRSNRLFSLTSSFFSSSSSFQIQRKKYFGDEDEDEEYDL